MTDKKRNPSPIDRLFTPVAEETPTLPGRIKPVPAPSPKPRRGQALTIHGQRRKHVDFWMDMDLYLRLEELRDAERAKRRKAGKPDYVKVNVTNLIAEAIGEYLSKHKP
jgi:hypothetical protein